MSKDWQQVSEIAEALSIDLDNLLKDDLHSAPTKEVLDLMVDQVATLMQLADVNTLLHAKARKVASKTAGKSPARKPKAAKRTKKTTVIPNKQKGRERMA